jgi:phosphatidylserine/phosphatidylglycerophosphate/cardiolipin synthase-like enzyme
MADLNFDADPFPPADRYPLNSPSGKVYPWVKKELDSGPTLVITGFSSLEFLVKTLSALPLGQSIRVLIGQEPVLRVDAPKNREVSIERDMREWWVEKGFSILSGGAVQDVVARIDRGQLQFRLMDQLHAKIVVGPGAAILGSSNFSHSGLNLLKEANVRRERTSAEYSEIQRIAEAYWDAGRPANDIIRNLLLELLRPMTWQEVLAIAGSLLLEGDWLKRIPELARRFESLALWESQKQALSQALYSGPTGLDRDVSLSA